MKVAIDSNNRVYSIPDKHIENDVNEFKGQSVEYSSNDNMLDNKENTIKQNKKKGKHS